MLRMMFNKECVITFAHDEKKCPICEQSNEVYLTRISDGQVFCAECYKAWTMGREEAINRMKSMLGSEKYRMNLDVSIPDIVRIFLSDIDEMFPDQESGTSNSTEGNIENQRCCDYRP